MPQRTSLRRAGIHRIDLTPAAVGPFVIHRQPHEHLDAPNVNMVTAGQATVRGRGGEPRHPRPYGEIVASVSSVSRRDAREHRRVHAHHASVESSRRRTRQGIILNPAEPPRSCAHGLLRDRRGRDEAAISDSSRMSRRRAFVPAIADGRPQFDRRARMGDSSRGHPAGVEGRGDYFPICATWNHDAAALASARLALAGRVAA